MSSLPPNVNQPGQPQNGAPQPGRNVQPARGQQVAQPESTVQADTKNRVDTGASPPVDPLTNHPLRYTAGRQAETKKSHTTKDKDAPVNEQTPQAEEERKRNEEDEKNRTEAQSAPRDGDGTERNESTNR